VTLQEEARKLQEVQTECNELREETEKRLHEISSYRDEVEQKNTVIKEIQAEVVNVSYTTSMTETNFVYRMSWSSQKML